MTEASQWKMAGSAPMDKSAFTAGPWRVTAGGYVRGADVVVARVGALSTEERALMADTSGKRWAADARLIAAALELYDVAEFVLAVADCYMVDELIIKARAALRKARGEP